MSECICNDLIYYDNCVICLKSFPMLDTKHISLKCVVHRPIMCCGHTEFVCNACKKVGWYSTAGTGGGHYHRNDELGISINKRSERELPEGREAFGRTATEGESDEELF